MSAFCPLSHKNTVKLLCDARESINTGKKLNGQLQRVLKKLRELLCDARESINTGKKLNSQLQRVLNKLRADM